MLFSRLFAVKLGVKPRRRSVSGSRRRARRGAGALRAAGRAAGRRAAFGRGRAVRFLAAFLRAAGERRGLRVAMAAILLVTVAAYPTTTGPGRRPDRRAQSSSRWRRRQSQKTTPAVASTETRASHRLALSTRARAASQLRPRVVPAATRKAYQMAEAVAAGIMARHGGIPTTPAKGVTAARTPGRNRLRNTPSTPCRA